MTNPTRIYKKIDFEQWQKPFVYVWKRGKRILYVGATYAGLSRLMSHQVIGIFDDFLEEDEIEIYEVLENDIYVFEATLIKELNPEFNNPTPKLNGLKVERICPLCKIKFMQRRNWQVYCSTSCSRRRTRII